MSERPTESPRRGPSGARPPRGVVVATSIVAIAVVVAGGIAVGLALSSGSTAKPVAQPQRSTHASTTVPTHSTPGAATTPSSTVPASAPAGVAPAAASGGAPHVANISPASGAPGQTVTVRGSGLYSADGLVTAYFGGAPAPTSCPSQSSCTVTVPDLGAAHPTTMTIVTSSGTSNAVSFDYE